MAQRDEPSSPNAAALLLAVPNPADVATQATPPDARPAAGGSRMAALAGDVAGGLVASTACVAFTVANGALIYSGALPSMLRFGIAAGLVTSAVTAIVLALTSSFRPVVGTVNSTTAAPLGAILASMAPTLAHLPPPEAAATIVALVAITTGATGLVLLLLGSARLGKIVRFIPFPIVAGFMGVTGTLLVFGAARFGTGVRVVWAELPRFLQPGTASLLALTLGFALLITVVTRRFRHPLVLPGLLLAAILVADALTYAAGRSIETPPLAGLFLVPNAAMPSGLPLLLSVPQAAHWSLIPPMSGAIAAYVLLIVLATLITSTGLEAALDVDADYDLELRSQGSACLAATVCGGFVANPSVGATMAGVATGARGRAAGLTNAAVMLVLLFVALPLLPYVPRFVIGGLLAHIGVWIIVTWCVATRSRMPAAEWLVVVGIVAVTVWFGLVAAILAGIVAGCILFAVDVSRIDVVRREYGLDRRASIVVRPSEELAALSREGRRVRFIELSGMLFFGSAYQILARVRRMLAEDRPDTIVLDLTAVTGCDSSAAAVIARMRKTLKREAIGFVAAGGDAVLLELLRNSGCLLPGDAIYPATDKALQAAEDAILRTGGEAAASPPSLRLWLARALGGDALAAALIGQCRCEDHASGDYLCREGEPTKTLLFIESGRVAVMIGSTPGERCVRIFGPHTIAGEHGFVLGLPRSASLKVEEATRVWVLDRTRFAAIETDRPDLAIALLRNIVRLQSERLAFATRQNAALA